MKRAALLAVALVAGCAPGAGALSVKSATTPQTAATRGNPNRGPAEGGPREVGASLRKEAPAVRSDCPKDMVLLHRVEGAYCIDRYEASIMKRDADGTEHLWPSNKPVDGIEDEVRAVSVPGRLPQGYISGKQAAKACAHSGKRLCEIDEWVLACRGPKLQTYPYGNVRKPNVCNDRYKVLDHHPVARLFRKYAPPGTPAADKWLPSWMNDPRLFEMSHSVKPAGAMKQCTNAYGVYDMVGNLHEWVDDADGTFFGGFFMDTFQNGQGCEYRTTGHPFDYHDYSTGFRCCADPRTAPADSAGDSPESSHGG